MQDLTKIGVIKPGEFNLFEYSTRDCPVLPSLKCKDGTIFLSMAKRPKFTFNPFKYWRAKNLEDALCLTLVDDQRRVEYIRCHDIDSKILLDYGCGNNGFVNAIYSKGLKPLCYALDQNKRLINRLFDEFPDTLFAQSIKEVVSKIDIVTLWHCLEHIANPIDALLDIKGVLSDCGEVHIEVPNAKDYMIDKCPAYKQNSLWSEHVVIYTENSLRKLVEWCGFEVVDFKYIQRYSKSNHDNWLNHGCGNGLLVSETEKTAYESSLERDGQSDTMYMKIKVRK